ncbi:potassium channel family protein [Pengzhenrongella frigida]|uniref:Two pore domain potassium channel family protein n=1 Tax=Pengzhenrongella frigida TaxID=1259133 RepID=A0A4Q5N3I7_9MICO|nr:potassium channel family protein [Cellulomonas sp. HLT2-17]RYV52715.1 two pore domain potassium channel family protein [Cellulomonas sp. HLT2-17]
MPEAAAEESIAHQLSAFLWRTTLMLMLLTASYFVLPAGGPFDDPESAARAGCVLLALAGIAVVLRVQRRARRAGPSVWTRAETLLTALYVLILVFAVTYDRIASSSPDQFSGMENRTDALYFTVTTVATVGYGDIHAVSSPARLLVTAQMLLNLIYVGTALRVLSNLRGFGQAPAPHDGGTRP